MSANKEHEQLETQALNFFLFHIFIMSLRSAFQCRSFFVGLDNSFHNQLQAYFKNQIEHSTCVGRGWA